MNIKYTELNIEYSELNIKYAKLNIEYDKLNIEYAILNIGYAELNIGLHSACSQNCNCLQQKTQEIGESCPYKNKPGEVRKTSPGLRNYKMVSFAALFLDIW